MLIETKKATWNKNCYLIINSYSDINLVVKLIKETDIFKI